MSDSISIQRYIHLNKNTTNNANIYIYTELFFENNTNIYICTELFLKMIQKHMSLDINKDKWTNITFCIMQICRVALLTFTNPIEYHNYICQNKSPYR